MNTTDKIQPESSPRPIMTYIAILIMAAQVLLSVVTYPFLPATIPSHWNMSGQVDAYSSKLFMAIFFPLLSIGLYVLVRGLVIIGPRLGSQPKYANLGVTNSILLGVLLFMLVMHLASTAISLGISIDITLVVSLSVNLLFIFIGNYMVKLRRNFWGGIRTPWTLASDTVWERTHRLGGWMFVLGGLLGLVLSFIPQLRFWSLISIILIVSLVPIVYSYIAYQRYVVSGKPPPFPTI